MISQLLWRYLRPELMVCFFPVLSCPLPGLLSDVLSPTVVSVSDSSPHQIRVSWGPLQPNRVQRYVVEYGAIPSGRVQTMTLQRQQNSTLLTGLEPGTQYLVTVSAVHADGKERAMSVRACTQEGTSSVWCLCSVCLCNLFIFGSNPLELQFHLTFLCVFLPAAALPALADLQPTQVQHQEVQVAWHGHQEGLMGYWLSWERQNSYTSSVYLHPNSRSTRLTHFTPGSRVCVSPVYSSGRGDGICCTAERNTGWLNWVLLSASFFFLSQLLQLCSYVAGSVH